jgi:hypothetical protein
MLADQIWSEEAQLRAHLTSSRVAVILRLIVESVTLLLNAGPGAVQSTLSLGEEALPLR